jgi:DivIVA domain-containing protein
MNDNSDLLPNLTHDDAFEVQLRGYSRRQVDEFLARCRSQIRDLEQRLARSLDESEELRRDLATARQQALGAKPAHEEVSERISQKSKAADDIAQQRSEAQGEAERVRTEAREQAERMLTAAQEQAERAITTARAEAEKTRNAARAESERMTTTARTEAERVTSTTRAEAERLTTTARADAERTTTEAQKKAETALASAKAQAKKALDEATARATAIHDGAERRLNMLSNRHGETVKRLGDILEGVSALVAAENARPSLEDEVDQATANRIANPEGGPAQPQSAPGQGAAGQGAAGQGAAGQGPALHGPAGHGPAGHAATGQPAAAHSSGPAAHPAPAGAKRVTAGRPTSTIDEDESTEGIRVMPAQVNQ